MANNYSDMTGVLVLSNVTPVIKALFGPYELDENSPGNGQAYIANIAESSYCSWDAVLENLEELVEKLALALPEDADGNVPDHLRTLATHFGAEQATALHQVIEYTDFDSDASVDDLFAIAKVFDDGHGLTACKTETSWHCSKPRLFEFGGAGEFIGTHVSVGESSSAIVHLGEKIESALAAGDIDNAAEIVFSKVTGILNGILDESVRESVHAKVRQLLTVETVPMPANNESKHYIGKLKEINGEQEYTHMFRFVADDPVRYLDNIASRFYGDNGGDQDGDSYFFNGGTLVVKPAGYQEISRDLYLQLHGIVTGL